MCKAEKFIKDNTRNCSNFTGVVEINPYRLIYESWITPDQARKAVEIAREEIYEWIRNNVMVTNEFEADVDVDAVIKDLKQAMKDE